MIGAIFIVAWVAFIVGVLVGVDLARAPLCDCADVNCRGGCIDWERAA